MSYDLAVFEPSAAPRDREAFLKWFEKQTDWDDDLDYDQPENTTPALKQWLYEIIERYPPTNGPMALELDDGEDLSAETSDYSIAKHLIYVGVSWNVSKKARKAILETAEKYGVGFFDVSARDGEIIFPVGAPAGAARAKSRSKKYPKGRPKGFFARLMARLTGGS